VNDKVTAYFNGNVKMSSIDRQTSFDPRLSLVYRPDGANVFRVSAGHSTESPSAVAGSYLISTQPGAVNPSAGLTSIGTAPNSNLTSEKSNELELSVGHRFSHDSQIQVVGYEQDITDPLYASTESFAQIPGATPADISAYIARAAQLGINGLTAANFGLTVANNAGAGRFRGIDVTGRQRFTRNFYSDYGYDLMSAQYYGIPVASMMSTPSLINGGQIVGVPFQKANLALDYTLGDKTEVRIDGYFQGNNNALHRPPFFYADGFISRPLEHNMFINVGVSNIFNSAYQQYGQIGYATYIPENQYASDPNSLSEAYNGVYGEEFGLPARMVTVSVSAKIR
jgi:hypothetical protein